MAGQRFTKRNRGSDGAKVRRRRQLVGLGVAAGTFLAAAMTPLAAAPTVNADPILNTVSGLVHFGPVVGPAPGGDTQTDQLTTPAHFGVIRPAIPFGKALTSH